MMMRAVSLGSVVLSETALITLRWAVVHLVLWLRIQWSHNVFDEVTSKVVLCAETLTSAFKYSNPCFLKKLVLPWSEIISMKSKGFVTLYNISSPRATSRWSAMNSMYWHISLEFMLMSETGRASERTLVSTHWLCSGNATYRSRIPAR